MNKEALAEHNARLSAIKAKVEELTNSGGDSGGSTGDIYDVELVFEDGGDGTPLTGFYEVDGTVRAFFTDPDGNILSLSIAATSTMTVYIWAMESGISAGQDGDPECDGCDIVWEECDPLTEGEGFGIRIELTNFTGNVTATIPIYTSP